MVFPPVSCFRLLFLQKAIIGLIEKVFSRALFAFNFELFVLYCFILFVLYATASGNTWAFCTVFSIRNSFLSIGLIFLISVSVEAES